MINIDTVRDFRFKGIAIPEHMHKSIVNYVEEKYPVGDFLRSVIENDLRGACLHADNDNLQCLPAFVAFFYNEAPSVCWGSRDNYKQWTSPDVTGQSAKIPVDESLGVV